MIEKIDENRPWVNAYHGLCIFSHIHTKKHTLAIELATFEKKVLTFTKKPVFYFSKDVASRVWFKMAHAQFCWQRKHFKNQVWSIYFRYFIMFATWKRVMSFISRYDMQKFVLIDQMVMELITPGSKTLNMSLGVLTVIACLITMIIWWLA